MMRTAQNGNSMVEMMGVIALIAILSISTIKLIGTATSRYKLNVVVEQIRELHKNISSYYSTKGAYPAFTNTVIKELIKEKVIPSGIVTGEAALHNVFRGEIKLDAVNSIMQGGVATPVTDNIYFQVAFNGLSKSACVELGMMNWMFNGSSDLVNLKINDSVYQWPLGGKIAAAVAMPMDTARVMAVCKDNNENKITWILQ